MPDPALRFCTLAALHISLKTRHGEALSSLAASILLLQMAHKEGTLLLHLLLLCTPIGQQNSAVAAFNAGKIGDTMQLAVS
jgi:hypothetical protein